MDKHTLSERDICTKFITPALRQAGWDEMSQIREEVSFTKGRIIVRGKLVTSRQGQARRLRPLLQAQHPAGADRGQGQQPQRRRRHAAGPRLRRRPSTSPSCSPRTATASCSTTAPARAARPRRTSPSMPFRRRPSSGRRYRAWKGLTPEAEQIVLQDYFDDGSGKAPRYYQVNAVNAAIEAIAKGQRPHPAGHGDRHRQDLHRLSDHLAAVEGRAARSASCSLADRNVLIDQTMVNDFRPFGAAMAKLSTNAKTIERDDGTTSICTTALDRKRRIDTAYEIYLGLYQAITGPEERQKLFREFSPGFFDLIVIDECHRGSAAEDSAWREILEYFSSATQIGLTATPKETKYVSNIDYFGDAGLLLFAEAGHPRRLPRALQGGQGPYRPRRGGLSAREGPTRPRGRGGRGPHLQHQGLRPHAGARRPHQAGRPQGHRVPEGERRPLPEDHRLLRRSGARRRGCGRRSSTRTPISSPRTTATSCASPAATTKARTQLGNFIDPESKYPVLVTTSRLLSTGVDAQTCRLIVLDREVGSMTEFKQIVGRGTRVHEDTKKFYFTLIDFRGATSHFADPDFDGEPVQIYEPGEDDPIAPPDDVPPTGEDGELLPDTPGADEIIVDGEPPDISIPRGRRTQAENLCRWRRRRDRRRAGGISRRERQARHREPCATSPRRR